MKNFEMANADDPDEIIKATQAAVMTALIGLIAGLKKDMGGQGPTWESLEYLLEEFAKKKPTIIKQEHEA